MRVEDEIAALEESKRNLEEELKGIQARIEELQKSPPKKESA
jgi:peptidoglycan hydrolase CwlO-like protein